jgi:hypothetical protein
MSRRCSSTAPLQSKLNQPWWNHCYFRHQRSEMLLEQQQEMMPRTRAFQQLVGWWQLALQLWALPECLRSQEHQSKMHLGQL